ncbi:hypothetical protein PILCRDRAFT_293145 [Piloderma croceum F 1598]|uniref:Uncharacterized protein n=1 Tax=Piloderma croceum (strain F 1598) TaxID=765440 RepID=A0A0C3BKK3_PILCF|nr:hypothetical protein PILCRDRAFT_293145 [Piloderma croceum F 1598]
MAGYFSYLSEIHAQILKLHTTYVPTDYHSLLLFLLRPAIWWQKGSVPRLRYHSMRLSCHTLTMHGGQCDYARNIPRADLKPYSRAIAYAFAGKRA